MTTCINLKSNVKIFNTKLTDISIKVTSDLVMPLLRLDCCPQCVWEFRDWRWKDLMLTSISNHEYPLYCSNQIWHRYKLRLHEISVMMISYNHYKSKTEIHLIPISHCKYLQCSNIFTNITLFTDCTLLLCGFFISYTSSYV